MQEIKRVLLYHFDSDMQEQVESLTSQGAVALTNKKLVGELKTLFRAFVQLIATAIVDKKSEYTGGHCSRVPIITMMLADEVAKVSLQGNIKILV